MLNSGQAAVEDALATLVKNGAIRRLKQNVSSWIAEGYFRFDFLIKIVRSVLRLPKAVPKVELIEECAIYAKRPTSLPDYGIFRYKFPAVRTCAVIKKNLEGRPNSALMRYATLFEFS